MSADEATAGPVEPDEPETPQDEPQGPTEAELYGEPRMKLSPPPVGFGYAFSWTGRQF